MISFINSWGKNVIVSVVIGTLIELLIPEGSSKKYIKTIIGIYIVFVIISPVIKAFSKKSNNINKIIENVTKQVESYESIKVDSIDEKEYISKEYKEKIKEDIKEKLSQKGYDLENINIEIETNDENNYGKILGMNIKVKELEKNKKVKNIEEIKINIEENVNKIEEESEEIKKLKEYLIEEYEVDNIVICKEA